MVGVSEQINSLSAKKECSPVISRVTSVPGMGQSGPSNDGRLDLTHITQPRFEAHHALPLLLTSPIIPFHVPLIFFPCLPLVTK